MATLDDVRTVWELIGDDETAPTWSQERVTAYLTRAGGCVYGAAALLCRAWAAKLAQEWTKVSAGEITREKSDPSRHMNDLAEQYAAMSTTVSFDERKRPAFGRARVDWMRQTDTRSQTARLYDENTES